MRRFDIRSWHKYRNQLLDLGKQLGKYIKDKKAKDKDDKSIDDNDPAIDLLYVQINQIHQAATLYMTQRGIIPPPAKWRYDAKDTRTHASHHDFAYKDLL